METNEINIEGLNKAALLAALFNYAKPFGMNRTAQSVMSEEEAEQIIKARTRDSKGAWRSYFDYLQGRPMKLDIGGDTLDPFEYDRENGQGSTAAVITLLRNRMQAA